MKTKLIPNLRARRWFGLMAVVGASCSAWAGSFFIDFNSDPTSKLNYCGTLWNGTSTANTGSANWQQTDGAGAPTNTLNGPVSGVTGDGFLQLTFADNNCAGGRSSALCGGVLFEDFDNQLIVQAFTFECDLRIGNGNPNPADGFSINYVRANDPVLAGIAAGFTLPQMNGNAGGPAAGYAFSDNGGSGDLSLMEEGCQTGLSVGFDMWDSGNYTIPPTGNAKGTVKAGLTHDGIGLDIRVDGVMQTTIPMPNGTTQGTSDQFGNALANTDPNGNNAATDPTSIETGPFDGTGCDNTLRWVHLKVVLDTNQLLSVFWKNTQILTNYPTAFRPSAGRLLMASRVGGNTANIEVDNISLVTVPATKPLLGPATGYPDGVSVTFSDSGSTVDITKPYFLSINSLTNVPATISKVGAITTVSAHLFPTLLGSGSTNTLWVTVTDSGNQPVNGTENFIVPVYNTVSSATAVTGVDTSKKGLRMKTWQSGFEYNINWWAQEQLAGQHGTNEADTTSFTDNGFFDFVTGQNAGGGPAGVVNMDYGANNDGFYTAGVGYADNLWPGLTPAANGLQNIDFSAGDIQCWVSFSKAGVYTMGVNSDDGFKLTTGLNPSDWGALNVGEFNGGRGASGSYGGGTLFTFVVTNAATYPFRLVWENGTGGANCEWFSVTPYYGTPGVAGCNAILVGDPDPTNTTGIAVYYAGPAQPAWVSWLYPTPGSSIGDPILVKASITDGASKVTAASITLSVDGGALTATNQSAGGVTTVTAYKSSPLAAGAHTAQLVYTTTGTGGGTFTNTWSYTVPSYATLNPAWAVTGVDTTKPGFLLRTWQSTGGTPATENNTVQWMQEQLAGLHGANNVDPTLFTHQVYSQGYTNFAGLINFDGTGVYAGGSDNGNFQTYDNYPDGPFPGLPSTAGLTGDSSLEALCYVYLDHPGLYSMRVNSDDGFLVTAGASPADWLTSLTIGSFNGGRGSSDSTFSFLATTAGFYPFRMAWENGDGELPGNGCNCEWSIVEPTFSPVLINDPRTQGDFGNAPAYYSGPLNPAFISAVQPYPGSGPNRPDAPFLVNLNDGSTTVNSSSVKVYINGKQINGATVAKSGGVTSVTMPAGYLLPGDNGIYATPSQTQYALDTAAVVYTTGAGTFSNSWTFTVYPWGGLDPAWVSAGVDVSKIGFKVRPWQSSGLDNTSQPNTVRWTEEQLAGAHGPNHADLTQATDGGYIDYTQIINWDNAPNHDGNFQTNGALGNYPDIPFPGSKNVSSWNNAAEEVIGWMHFNSPGLYQFGVNSDDGFKVTAGPNPKDWLNSTTLGFANYGKGASDIYYFVNVTNAGYYPMRLIWENGGGGFNCEWFSYAVGDNTVRYLVNDPDPTNQSGVVFYYGGPQLPAYVSGFWPDKNATGVQQGMVSITLQDGSTTVTPGSITVTLNGAPVTATITSSGGVTKITTPLALPAGTYTAVVTYSTSGGGPFTASWTFTTTSYQWGVVTLSTNLWTPPGSGTNTGFAIMQPYQDKNQGALIFNGWQNNSRMFDEALQGYYDTNAVTDTVDYTNHGTMWWPGVINFSQNSTGARTDNGDFQAADGTADVSVPGLPALSGNMNDDGWGAKMFLEFPAPGPYVMGFNSDDGFRLATGDQDSPDGTGLSVIAPASAAKTYVAMYTTTADEGGNNGFGRTPPSTVPIIAHAVVCDPNTYASGTLNNAAALNGNVAVVLHNGNMANQCFAIQQQATGVVAIIVCNSAGDSATPYPGTRGSGNQDVALPLVSSTYQFWQDITNNGATTAATSPLIVRVTAQDCSPICGKYDNGRGAGTDGTLFTIQVPAAGVYPFRLVWENGGGDANSELYVQDIATGIRTLVNDPASPVKSWISRNVHAAGALPAPKLNEPVVSGGNVMISWTGEGELWEAYSLNGPWFKSTYQSNPSTVVTTPLVAERFFRVRMY